MLDKLGTITTPYVWDKAAAQVQLQAFLTLANKCL
jgi:hypothetical protein